MLTIENQFKTNRDYEYYLLARENYKLLIKLLDNALYYANIFIEEDNKTLKEINDKIKYYSNLEKHLILTAFLLQLTVFIIIQFFYLSIILTPTANVLLAPYSPEEAPSEFSLGS